jgi:Uma2 family endonuclease
MATSTLTRQKSIALANGRAISMNFDGIAFSIPESAFQFDGFRAWTKCDDFPERGRVDFIDGEVIVDMSQEEYTTHVYVKAAIVKTLMTINDEEELGRVSGDGGRITNESASISNEPDASFVSYTSLESKAAVFTPRQSDPEQTIELVGTPDLVVEVVSDSSATKDYEKLRVRYHTAGISEYWLVDARGDDVDFQILLHRRAGYVAAASREGWVRSRVFNREFRLLRKKDRVGMWTYRLETRPR